MEKNINPVRTNKITSINDAEEHIPIYIAEAVAAGHPWCTIFLIGDHIAWTPNKLSPSCASYLYHTHLKVKWEGLTTKEWDQIRSRIALYPFTQTDHPTLFNKM